MANQMANIKDSENITFLSGDEVVLVDDDVIETPSQPNDYMVEAFLDDAPPKRKSATFYMRADLEERINTHVSNVNRRLKGTRRSTITKGDFLEKALDLYFMLMDEGAKQNMSAEKYVDSLMHD